MPGRERALWRDHWSLGAGPNLLPSLCLERVRRIIRQPVSRARRSLPGALARQGNEMVEYAGFWKRTLALLVDTAVLLPIALLNIWSWYESNAVAVVSAILLCLVSSTYIVVLHGLCGQSIGKMVVGLKVEQVDGSRLTWKGTWLRSCPVIAIYIVAGAGSAYSINSIPPDSFMLASYTQKGRLVREHKPSWAQLSSQASLIWVFAEAVVLGASKQKRAIHDFLGGTIVRCTKLQTPVAISRAG